MDEAAGTVPEPVPMLEPAQGGVVQGEVEGRPEERGEAIICLGEKPMVARVLDI